MATPVTATCEDIQLFMDQLKQRRLGDDRIIHELNTIFPTKEFAGKVDFTQQCKSLYHSMRDGHLKRHNDITSCINYTAEKAKVLKEQRDADKENYKITKILRKEQGNTVMSKQTFEKLRLFQQELNVEEIVWERAEKAFNERCRTYYKPEL